ncbi:MAG TPA: helix-hairpin-helix domain-containing protein [Gemmatimonadaceae bacterium]|nr:helix-hairpin-helix domain-containing protein [Gemmatimonadaceae bacterium]
MIRTTALPIGILAAALVVACGSDTNNAADTAAVADTGALATPPATSTTPAGGMIDPNSASSSDLAAVPGIGDSIATRIVAARPIASMTVVEGLLPRSLTERQRDSVYTRIWKPIDLNTATDAEILLIPGVGSRMLHEFKEYRPYTSIEQFRREIGKYVDDAELVRLERYVAAP